MPKIIQMTTDTLIDQDGNLIQQEQRNVIQHDIEPNYIKLYLDNILYLSDLPSGLNTVLMALLKRMTYNNEIVINTGVKRRILEETGLAMSSISNAITSFVKGNILIRVETGIYVVNPHLFGKGKWEDIQKIRLEVIFSPKGKTLKASIEKSDEMSSERL